MPRKGFVSYLWAGSVFPRTSHPGGQTTDEVMESLQMLACRVSAPTRRNESVQQLLLLLALQSSFMQVSTRGALDACEHI